MFHKSMDRKWFWDCQQTTAGYLVPIRRLAEMTSLPVVRNLVDSLRAEDYITDRDFVYLES